MKAALVTGGARRIGAAIARRLAAEGCGVAIHCRLSRDEADALAAEIRASGGRAVVVKGDLAEPDRLGPMIAEAAAALGPLGLLVNNASIFWRDDLDTLSAGSFDAHMAVNLRAPLLLARAFAAQAPPGASIVNLIDQRVLKPRPDYLSYALSKEALWSATRILARALAPAIRVNAVGPGPTLPNETDGEIGFEREAAATLLARPVDPAEIADAVVFLARSPSITGQMIAVDAGQHLAWKTPDVLATGG
jgi:NAD(P)-dependent dehydrogenase (short-subunit alcohol dehydrogenase family)